MAASGRICTTLFSRISGWQCWSSDSPQRAPALAIWSTEPPRSRYGHYVPVRAEVVDLPGFSVHADADGILAWLSTAARPLAVTYVVHGERDAAAALRDHIQADLGWQAVVPLPDERVLI